MKTKLILCTCKKNFEQWTELPFVPRINEWLNIREILGKDEITTIKQSSDNWSGIRSIIWSVEYRHNDDGYYIEIVALCEDSYPTEEEQPFQWNFNMNLIKFH
jgi:hypothetical protein